MPRSATASISTARVPFSRFADLSSSSMVNIFRHAGSTVFRKFGISTSDSMMYTPGLLMIMEVRLARIRRQADQLGALSAGHVAVAIRVCSRSERRDAGFCRRPQPKMPETSVLPFSF